MKVPQPIFSDWFKKHIEDAKLSHTGFAERTGLSLSTVNNLKAGHSGYSSFTLRKVLQAFGIKMTVQEFLSELVSGRDPDIIALQRVNHPNETV